MPSERRERHPRGGVEHRSESGGGLLGIVLTLVGIPVGWFVSVVAGLIVATNLVSSESVTLVAGIGPTTTLYASIGVLVVFAFTTIVLPDTIFAGWLLMGIIVAVAATFFLDWTTLLLIFEGLTVIYIVFAAWMSVVTEIPDWYMFARSLERW